MKKIPKNRKIGKLEKERTLKFTFFVKTLMYKTTFLKKKCFSTTFFN